MFVIHQLTGTDYNGEDFYLPAVTVTGNVKPTPPSDTVSRDWAERSPEMHWPTTMFNGAAEIFTHNQIEINASCTTVWDRLVQAERWPQWCPFSSKVQIWGEQRRCKKTASSPGLVPTCRKISRPWETFLPPRLNEWTVWSWNSIRRIGSAGAVSGGLGLSTVRLVDSYHNWYIKPIGAKKCVVTFEEVATGLAARYARGAYPELVHVSHDDWLRGLKRLAESPE
jgi:Polyketide cyclase / dehydrase and lipid transport